ncbi:MAG: hypothetical protein IJF02_02135 [Oscillospiraceae bacterium]|nr:hypothetical protein [Oscillospiraceae bacterium]
MKKTTVLFMTTLLLVSVLTGCRSNVPQDTTGNIVPSTTTSPTTTAPSTTTPSTDNQGGETEATAQLLQSIWDKYADEERFAAYGGAVENSISDAPGSLDVTNAEEMTNRYLVPQEQLKAIQEAASLVHMMNSNIFTAVAVKIGDNADQKALQTAWRDAIQGNQWICGQPDRLLMADIGEGYMVMAFGSADAMELFSGKLAEVYPDAQSLYNEAIVS